MGKYEYLRQLSNAGLPVPPFVEVTQVVVTDLPFVRSVLGDGPYAVRSSCDYEDSMDTANAGRYTSVVGISFDALPGAVNKVRESYGKADGKIIVQAAICPVLSGIAFSSSPEGFIGEVVMSFGQGLGENVVTDSVDVITYHVSHDGSCVWQSGDYGSIADAVDRHDLYMRNIVDEVAGLVRRCADVIGSEADMEFAIDDESRIWVLQARPITRIAGMGQREALRDKELLDASNIIESYPGVVLPLTQSFASEMYRRIFTAAIDRLTGTNETSKAMSTQLSKMLVFSDWHAYYRISSWYAVLSLVPLSGIVKRAWRASLGVEHGLGDSGVGTMVSPSVRREVLRQFLRYMRITPRETAKACDRIREVLDRAWEDIGATDDAEELLRISSRVQDEVLSCWDITLFNDIYTFFWTFLAGRRTKRIMATNAELASMRPVKAMRALMECARVHGMGSDEYAELRAGFIVAYGDRVPGELKLETRTWRSRPEMLDERISSALGGDGSKALQAEPDGLAGRQGRTTPPTTPAMRRALRGAEMRERSRLMRTEMFGIVRTCYDKVGKSLVDHGSVADGQDIYYLTMQEVAEAVADGRDMRDTVAKRKQVHAALTDAPSPKTLYACGPVPWNHSVGSLGHRFAGTAWESEGLSTGIGTSPGKVVAEALVTDGVQVASTKGKVIVAVSTDPGWAYMLDGAAAIVAERGSLLSHTAIISREMGIPAVVGVRNATEVISSGDMVEVDGDSGTVRIVRRHNG